MLSATRLQFLRVLVCTTRISGQASQTYYMLAGLLPSLAKLWGFRRRRRQIVETDIVHHSSCRDIV